MTRLSNCLRVRLASNFAPIKLRLFRPPGTMSRSAGPPCIAKRADLKVSNFQYCNYAGQLVRFNGRSLPSWFEGRLSLAKALQLVKKNLGLICYKLNTPTRHLRFEVVVDHPLARLQFNDGVGRFRVTAKFKPGGGIP